MKKETIKWLKWHLDEIINNRLAQTISKEDSVLNEKAFQEIEKCIEWIKKQK